MYIYYLYTVYYNNVLTVFFIFYILLWPFNAALNNYPVDQPKLKSKHKLLKFIQIYMLLIDICLCIYMCLYTIYCNQKWLLFIGKYFSNNISILN